MESRRARAGRGWQHPWAQRVRLHDQVQHAKIPFRGWRRGLGGAVKGDFVTHGLELVKGIVLARGSRVPRGRHRRWSPQVERCNSSTWQGWDYSPRPRSPNALQRHIAAVSTPPDAAEDLDPVSV